MIDDTLVIPLSDSLRAALVRVARVDGSSLEEAALRLLGQALETGPFSVLSADHPRASLFDDFTQARTWPELQGRLLLKGYALREVGGVVGVNRHPGGSGFCSLEELGLADAAFARIGRAFPSTASRWWTDAAIDKAPRSAQAPQRQAASR